MIKSAPPPLLASLPVEAKRAEDISKMFKKGGADQKYRFAFAIQGTIATPPPDLVQKWKADPTNTPLTVLFETPDLIPEATTIGKPIPVERALTTLLLLRGGTPPPGARSGCCNARGGTPLDRIVVLRRLWYHKTIFDRASWCEGGCCCCRGGGIPP